MTLDEAIEVIEHHLEDYPSRYVVLERGHRKLEDETIIEVRTEPYSLKNEIIELAQQIKGSK